MDCLPLPGAICIWWNMKKKIYIKSDFKANFLNLQQMGKVIRAFCWHQKFVPKGLSALAPGLYTYIKSLHMCIKSDFFFKLATNWQSDKGFLLTSNVCPEGVVCPCPGAIYRYKSLKMCIKSGFEEIILKLATYRQRVCPCPGAIYMYKRIKIYTRTRCQVSVYTGPLGFHYSLKGKTTLIIKMKGILFPNILAQVS